MTMTEPSVIDIVAEDPATGKLLLVMVEDRPWNGQAMSDEFVAKLGVYVSYALSEQFSVDHPDRRPSDVLIKLDCAYQPDPAMRDCFAQVPERLQTFGIDFAFEVFEDDSDDGPHPAAERPWWRPW
jgi:Family of unknown function (DUF6572)